MEDAESQEVGGEVCGLCQEPLADGETVVQVVEDRHPTYDKEIVLHTYHKACCDNRETVTHDCPHCGCWFHLSLLRRGADYQNLAQQLLCPFCGMLFDCDMGFAARPPRHSDSRLQRVPGEGAPEEPRTQGRPAARVMSVATAGLKVDRDLLERQAALLGRAVEGNSLTEEERKCLEGLWEFVHSVLDSLEAGTGKGSCERGEEVPVRPTVVVWVDGGVVQGVEADTAARVLVCDFDCEEDAPHIGERPCAVSAWDPPEKPSREFTEALRLAHSEDRSAPGQPA